MEEIARYLPYKNKTKFGLPPKFSLLRESCPKLAKANPQQCTQSAPNLLFTFGGVIAERVNTAKLPP